MSEEQPITLTFREKIRKSNNNTILSIPNLTHRNLVLSKIDFMAEEWHFEAVLKSAANDLVKMSTAFFQHQQSLDLNGYKSKIEEGDKLDLCIKPKQAPRDIELMVCYTYEQSLGSIYYQSNERVTDLNESTMLVDISQNMRPTRLFIKCDEKIASLSLTPKFMTSTTVETLSVNCSDNTCVINFDEEKYTQVLPLLRHYELSLKMEVNTNIDAQVYYLAQGFKN